MSATANLKQGMSPLDVCHTLIGWRFQQVQVVGEPARFFTWDFLSPDGSKIVRVTFDNEGLILWGPPSNEPHTLPSVTPSVLESQAMTD